MNIFIGKSKLPTLYIFDTEELRSKPHPDEVVAGVSARKIKNWKKTVLDFMEMQRELSDLYDGKVD